ncbi:hypothetical Protein YC6258_04791 [Gynuella sunshinyii YC6258]|uniref:Uncharacterized protein n=1 Tax=Gynuella sunshinyii YC6258 TaxID=1445510 RepID=A0A0C5VU47_9GAMM|nr:hypothetical Protein YC6258_04791 [Gynuella sunshinyii YC6258]
MPGNDIGRYQLSYKFNPAKLIVQSTARKPEGQKANNRIFRKDFEINNLLKNLKPPEYR